MAPNPLPTLALMAEDGVLAVLLPEAAGLERLAALVVIEPAADALRRLAALVGGAAPAVAQRLRLSSEQCERLATLAAPPWPVDLGGDERAQRRALYHLGAELYCDLVLLAAAAGGGARVPALLALAAAWRPASFPLKGRDVIARGIEPGPAGGRLLAELEEWWEEGDFRTDRRACLAELTKRLAVLTGR